MRFATIRARVALTLANVAAKIASPAVLRRMLSPVDDSRGWWPVLRHLNFQTDVEVNRDSVLAQSTVFACMTLIAGDIGKLRIKLVEQSRGIWQEITSPAFSPVLRKPNRFQTRQKFIEQWVLSLLSSGNAYVLKERDGRGVVVRMYVLDPQRVKPLVAPDGSVYYQLQEDDLSKVFEHVPAIPADEIIHDRINCLFHPLVGLSPIFACGLASTQSLKILNNSAKFFENASRPGGVLTGPGEISDALAKRIKDYWDQNFTGVNVGKVAVLGDGLDYKPMAVNPVDAQLVEQLKLSAEQICATFHVPAHKVGAGPVPSQSNVEALELQYYSQCLQTLIESIEAFLDDGLGLGQMSDGKVLGVEFDLDGLLRMDSVALTASLKDQVLSGILAPNEARLRLSLKPVKGGDSPMMQQQQFSLAALSERDQDKPFSKPTAPTPATSATPAAEDEQAREEASAAKAAAERARAEAAALEQRIAATELWTREAERRGAEDQTDKALALLFRKAPEELLHA